jgi:hypothetical protein
VAALVGKREGTRAGAAVAETPRPRLVRQSTPDVGSLSGVRGSECRSGKRYAGAVVRIVEVGELIHAYLGDELIRVLAPDRTQRCQKLGKRQRRRL